MPLPKSKYFIQGRKPGTFTASESSIQQTCVEFLILDDWRHLRTDPVSDRATVNAIRAKLAKAGLLTPDVAKLLNARGKGFGEEGMSDDLFMRYDPRDEAVERSPGNWHRFRDQSRAQVLWCEFKSENGKPKPHQLTWAAAERARGALVWLATVDFPPTIEGFREHYLKSGLARKVH